MDQDLKQQLDRIEKFMMEQLATKQEVSQLTERVNSLAESIERLTTSVANLAKQIHDFSQEHETLKHQLLAVQDWIRKAADKVGIEFKL